MASGVRGAGDAGEGEWLKVAELKSMAGAQDPQAKEVDNLTLRRFLRARGQDVGKASAMLLKFVAWRREAVPGGAIPAEQVREDIAGQKVSMGGVDRAGRPVMLAFPARHFSANRDMATFKRTYRIRCVSARQHLCQDPSRAGEVSVHRGPEGVGVRQLRRARLHRGHRDHAELLPGEAGQGADDQRPLPVHEGLEDGAALHRRQHQGQVRVHPRQEPGGDAEAGVGRDSGPGDVRREADSCSPQLGRKSRNWFSRGISIDLTRTSCQASSCGCDPS